MRVCTYTWPFTFGVGLGWATAGVPNPDPRAALGRVYLLRGQGVVFSGGMGALCRTLRLRGVWAEDLRCVGDRWALRHLLADRAAGRLAGPIVFVGHSCGGRYALFAAEQLRRVGAPVDLLVCIDVVCPAPVPANVRRAVNLYRSRWRVYPAGRLVAAPGSGAVVENFDLDAADSPIRERGVNHLNFTDSPGVQALVLGRILEAVAVGRAEKP